MTTSPVVTTKDLDCMLAACRLPRLPVRSGAAQEAPGSPLLCPGYCQPKAAAGCTNIAQMIVSLVHFPTLLAREVCTTHVIVCCP